MNMNNLAEVNQVKCSGYIRDGSRIDFPIVLEWISGKCPNCNQDNSGNFCGRRRCNICWTVGALIENFGF